MTSALSETANFTFEFNGQEDCYELTELRLIPLGTSATFIGAPPPEWGSSGIPITVTIDNSSSYNISFACANDIDCSWYTTSMLTQGQHTITFSDLVLGSIIDFAVVTTSVEAEPGDDIILDDNDSSFSFGSGWGTTGEREIVGSYGNGTHWSSTVGSEFVLDFVGRYSSSRAQLIIILHRHINISIRCGIFS